MFRLPALSYKYSALKPFLSKEQVHWHHVHHSKYYETLNRLVRNKPKASLEQLILSSPKNQDIYNNASQCYNHNLYWKILCPEGSSLQDESPLQQSMVGAFGGLEEFKNQFIKTALDRFGSGWCWLLKNEENELVIISTPNAESPLNQGYVPLLTCDLFEHAYLYDSRYFGGDRQKYLNNFFKCINWQYIEHRFMV